MNFVLNRVENIVRKGEIACTSIFSFFHYVFKSLLHIKIDKFWVCVIKGKVVNPFPNDKF